MKHNPDCITDEQIGVAQGWRLLEKDEVITRGILPSLDEIEGWSPHGARWCSPFIGVYSIVTYRTRLTRAELRKARGLEPEPELSSQTQVSPPAPKEPGGRASIAGDLSNPPVRATTLQPAERIRIYTRCPACHKDTLTINDDRHLLCTWIYCPDPTAIDRMGEPEQPPSNPAGPAVELPSYQDLRALFLESAAHLDYCGYGDAWERERADADNLRQRVSAMVALLEPPELESDPSAAAELLRRKLQSARDKRRAAKAGPAASEYISLGKFEVDMTTGEATQQPAERIRIYTRCPACHKDTLTINDDRHLLCTWIYCPDPTAIDRMGEPEQPPSNPAGPAASIVPSCLYCGEALGAHKPDCTRFTARGQKSTQQPAEAVSEAAREAEESYRLAVNLRMRWDHDSSLQSMLEETIQRAITAATAAQQAKIAALWTQITQNNGEHEKQYEATADQRDKAESECKLLRSEIAALREERDAWRTELAGTASGATAVTLGNLITERDALRAELATVTRNLNKTRIARSANFEARRDAIERACKVESELATTREHLDRANAYHERELADARAERDGALDRLAKCERAIEEAIQNGRHTDNCARWLGASNKSCDCWKSHLESAIAPLAAQPLDGGAK